MPGWRRRFTKQSLPGWTIVVGLTAWNLAVGAYRALDAWSNLDFLFTKFEAIGTALSAAWTTALSSLGLIVHAANSNLIQALLFLGGIGWILLTSTPAQPETAQLELSLKAPEPKQPRRNPKQQKAGALALLVRAIQHGDVLLHSSNWDLTRQWDDRNKAFIRAAWGEQEVERYSNDVGLHHAMHWPTDVIQLRLEKLRDIGRRSQFDDPPVRPDFNPQEYGYED